MSKTFQIPEDFSALRTYEVANSPTSFENNIEQIKTLPLKNNEVRIKVHFSSLNYKDFLSASGNKGVTRQFPHTPGIDASGEIVESLSNDFQLGDLVIVTGYDLGMNTDGGFAEYISVPSHWVVKKPTSLSLQEAMIYGTAGFTSAQSIQAIIENSSINNLKDYEIAVTGATGGVGSLAVTILSHLGYKVTAFTRKKENIPFLEDLGAKRIVLVDEWLQEFGESKKPLLKATWGGVVDTIGGTLLNTLIRTADYRSVVTCCGIIQGTSVNVSIFPFILRGVTLKGIDSAECPIEEKQVIWEKLATTWKPLTLEKATFKTISLTEVKEHLQLLKNGAINGRTLVKMI